MIVKNTNNINVLGQNPKKVAFKVEYFDTPYHVPTRGYGFEYYEDPDQNSSLGFAASGDKNLLVSQGKDNIFAYDWGYGAPPGISTNGYFKAKYYGFFYAKYQGTYEFRLFKEPNDYSIVYSTRTTGSFSNPTTTGSYASAQKQFDDWGTNHQAMTSGTWSITIQATHVNKWHPITILFAQREEKSYLTVEYLEPDQAIATTDGGSSDHDSEGIYHAGIPVAHWKPLSAGMFAYEPTWNTSSQASFMSPVIISGVNNVNIDKKFNSSSTADLIIPLLKVKNTTNLMGFRYEPQSQLYYDDGSKCFLRQGRLIKIYAGFASDGETISDADYIQRFEGIVTDINVDKDNSVSSKINVKCQDVLYLATTQINENYPNDISYEIFNFRSQYSDNQPNGATRPKAYDSWPLVDAIRDLYIKSGIDPTKLYGRKVFLDRDGLIVTGDYYIEDKNIQLKRRVRYGNPYVVDNDLITDDKYIWSFNFGDYLYTNIATLADHYGFVVQATPNGYPTFYSNFGATEVLAASGWIDTGQWTESVDSKANGGTYFTALASGDIMVTGFVGSAIAINLVKSIVPTGYQNWDLIARELQGVYNPARNAYLNPNFSQHYFGVLYGRARVETSSGEEGRYINSMVYFRPMTNMTVRNLVYYSQIDFPAAFTSEDFDLSADIYMGRVTSSDYSTLLSSSLVYSNYKRPNRGTPAWINNRVVFEHEINLTTPFSVVSGNIYAVRFVTKEDNGYLTTGNVYNNIDVLYTIENELRVPDDSTKVHMGMDNVRAYGNLWGTRSSLGLVLDSGVQNSDGTALNGGVYPQMIFKEMSNRSCEIKILALDPDTLVYSEVYTTQHSMIYTDPNATNTLRFPSDGPDKTGINPCVIYIGSNLLGNVIATGSNSSYGNYLVSIRDTSSSSDRTKVNSISVFEKDLYNPIWTATTLDNIIKINYESSMDDIRNYVVVIGDQISTVKEPLTDKIINKNNPTYDYIYSSAIDIGSISDPDSINNVGRKQPFILFQPSIVDQRHADWFAQALVRRYARFKKTIKSEMVGVSILENNDAISIVDMSSQDGGDEKSLQWINSITENIEFSKYYTNVESTPYEPWPSFQPRLNPDISKFSNYPFVNVRMTDTNNRLRGYPGTHSLFDVYENEISGVRLRVKYDQIIDGDVIVKVMSQDVLGVRTERTVAYLVGHLQDGVEIPEYREWGNDYELVWDGTDQTGYARSLLGQQIAENISGLIVSINNEDFISEYRTPGFYAPSGNYFLRFNIIPRNQSTIVKLVDSNKLYRSLNTEIAEDLGISSTSEFYSQTWNLKWGAAPQIQMLVSGQLPAAAARNITYFPNNVFWDTDNGGLGPEFTFHLINTPNVNRLLYYNVSLDHIWSIGYTFTIRNNTFAVEGPAYPFPTYSTNQTLKWRVAYEMAMKGNYLSRRGFYTNDLFWTGGDTSINVNDWTVAALITTPTTPDTIRLENYCHTEATEGQWGESKLPLNIPSRQLIVESGGRHRVYAWCEVPYIHYTIDDYIETRLHHYSATNPIKFYINPESELAGGWEFLAVPDLKEEAYNSFRRNLTLAAYYAGRETSASHRLQLMTAHAFQVNTLIWDNTGRILNNDIQKIAKPMAAHRHRLLTNASAETALQNHTHDNSSTKITLSRERWPLSLKNINGSEVIYDMTVTGLNVTNSGTFNYGTGYCNISGMPNSKFWTWHGYWKSSTYAANLLDVKIPFEHWELPAAKHWCRYAMPHETSLLYQACVLNNRVAGDDNDGWVFWDNSPGYGTLAESISGGMNFLEAYHTHLPIYEGLNDAIDVYGLIPYAISSSDFHITFDGNSPYYGELFIERDSWNNPTQWKEASFTPNSRDKYLNVSGDFPKFWYKLDKTLPWSNTAGVQDYWTNFLVESGFKFLRGGWSDLIDQ